MGWTSAAGAQRTRHALDRGQGQGPAAHPPNLGRATAYAVQLSADNAVRFNGPDEGNIEPSESLDFFAVGSMQTGTPELIVTWSDSPDGERREWRRPLP
jgi:hypothetical protein